jgi:hypothetical protein
MKVTIITKKNLKTFLRQINTLEELSNGGLYRADWWDTTERIGSVRLKRILKVAAARYDKLVSTNNKAGALLDTYLTQEGQIRKRLTHELKHAPKGTYLVALADGIEAEERGDSAPIEDTFKEFRNGIKAI